MQSNSTTSTADNRERIVNCERMPNIYAAWRKKDGMILGSARVALALLLAGRVTGALRMVVALSDSVQKGPRVSTAAALCWRFGAHASDFCVPTKKSSVAHQTVTLSAIRNSRRICCGNSAQLRGRRRDKRYITARPTAPPWSPGSGCAANASWFHSPSQRW